MSRFETRTSVEYRGVARKNEVQGIERYYTESRFIGAFRVQHGEGVLVVDADVLAKDVGEAVEAAAKTLRAAMVMAGWNRMTERWDTHVTVPGPMASLQYAA